MAKAARILLVMAKASEWAARVEAWRASGKSASEFCRGREYSATNLQGWVSHFRRHSIPVEAPGRPKGVALARVVRAQGAGGFRSAAIVVAIGEARVEVPAGVDPSALVPVL